MLLMPVLNMASSTPIREELVESGFSDEVPRFLFSGLKPR